MNQQSSIPSAESDILEKNITEISFVKSQQNYIERFSRKTLFNVLSKITNAYLVIEDPSGIYQFGSDSSDIKAHIKIHNYKAYRFITFGGSVGTAEAYVHKLWESQDLTAVIRVFARNLSIMDSVEKGFGNLLTPIRRLMHWQNKNTLEGSKENIAAHYNLGNDMFALFLDPTMMYSSAIFEKPDYTLQQASVAKMKRLCEKLDLNSDDHLVEIGTGWGSLAIYAAQNYGCKVTTTTISKEQYDYALEKIQKLGLENKITLLLKDYRLLTGKYDKLVTVEMIEAVGHQFYDEFFKTCSRLLKDDGLMAMQAITISDHRYKRALHRVDFIQKYIFPGSCIPSLTALSTAMSSSSDMRVTHLEDITEDYATTLNLWQKEFVANQEEILKLGGYDSEFIRLWKFYFSYCEGGFKERTINNIQVLYSKPTNRRQRLLC